jgi:type VI secretion system protein ImpA
MTEQYAHLAPLVAPLDGDAPCGSDMIFSTEFDELKELRRHDDASLSQGEWVTDLKRADWPAVMALIEKLLTQKSKDLRLVAWWAEAATRVNGYSGMADGLTLYATLCNTQWDHVHPLPEDGDQELRVGSVTWLITQTKVWLRNVPLLRHGEQLISLADIDAARQKASTGAAESEGATREGAAAALTLDVIARAQRNTPAAQVMSAVEGVRRVPEAVAALQAVIDARLGGDGPGFAPLRDAAQEAVKSVERLAREMGVLRSGETAAAQPANLTAVQADTSAGPVGIGAPANRAQAIAQLRMVAEFFRRTEPHSPVAYLAERAAHWGEMPLHEWLRAVLKEQGALGQLEELLGVQAASPGSNG